MTVQPFGGIVPQPSSRAQVRGNIRQAVASCGLASFEGDSVPISKSPATSNLIPIHLIEVGHDPQPLQPQSALFLSYENVCSANRKVWHKSESPFNRELV